MPDAKILAMCGKGGVGKTSLSSLMVKLLSARKDLKVLAIDADPAVGLASCLGVTVRRTVDDIRKDLIGTMKQGASLDGRAMLKSLDYEVFGALVEQDGFAFLAIGRPEDEGCFCRVNNLLKDIIRDLASSFDVVLIDGEAGVEQINRRVMKTVDHLVLVSDTSARGIQVANTIAGVASGNRAVDFKTMGLVLNRVKGVSEVEDIRKRTDLEIYGWISEDTVIRDFDFLGEPLVNIPGTSGTLGVVSDVLRKMKVLQ